MSQCLIPETARERNSESSAKLWLKEYNEGLRKAQHKVALAEYEYSTDLTPENAQKVSFLWYLYVTPNPRNWPFREIGKNFAHFVK